MKRIGLPFLFTALTGSLDAQTTTQTLSPLNYKTYSHFINRFNRTDLRGTISKTENMETPLL
ncbi:hypothetical protein ACFLTH_10175 [Bacteroidota bacterium]